MVTTDEVGARLSQVWPGVVTGTPVPLTGGYWASMFRVPVTGQPDGVASDLVVRFAPHPAMGAKEAEVQRAVAAQGFPTPSVWVSVRDESRDGWWSVMDFSHGKPAVVAALDALADDQPRAGGEVVCHGDLHPFNVLERGGELVVLDWTGALLAHPCFDLAFTELLLANPPLVLPGPLRPVGRSAGRLLARRFMTSYARANPRVSLDHLDWFRALHSARVLVEATNWRNVHGPAGARHPFLAVAPAAAEHLAAVTEVTVRPG